MFVIIKLLGDWTTIAFDRPPTSAIFKRHLVSNLNWPEEFGLGDVRRELLLISCSIR